MMFNDWDLEPVSGGSGMRRCYMSKEQAEQDIKNIEETIKSTEKRLARINDVIDKVVFLGLECGVNARGYEGYLGSLLVHKYKYERDVKRFEEDLQSVNEVLERMAD